MPFFIGLTQTAPSLDALPVALVKHYPLEKRDYKPYAQGRFCFAGGDFLCRLLAFEAMPQPHSQLRMVLCPLETVPPLTLNAFVEETIEAHWGEEQVTEGISAHFFRGEDLQGIYWGVDITVQRATLEKLFPAFSPQEGQILKGNLFKLCTHPEREHYGSFFPVSFTEENPYQQYGDFQITQMR